MKLYLITLIFIDENEFVQLTLSTYESLLSNNADAAFMKETITTAAKSKFHELDLDHSGNKKKLIYY